MITRLFLTTMIAASMAFMSVSCQRQGVQPVRKATTADSGKKADDPGLDPLVKPDPNKPDPSNFDNENEIKLNSTTQQVIWDGLADKVTDSNLSL